MARNALKTGMGGGLPVSRFFYNTRDRQKFRGKHGQLVADMCECSEVVGVDPDTGEDILSPIAVIYVHDGKTCGGIKIGAFDCSQTIDTDTVVTYTFSITNPVDGDGIIVVNALGSDGSSQDIVLPEPTIDTDTFAVAVDNGDGSVTITNADGTIVEVDADTFVTVVNNGDGTYTATNTDGSTVTWNGQPPTLDTDTDLINNNYAFDGTTITWDVFDNIAGAVVGTGSLDLTALVNSDTYGDITQAAVASTDVNGTPYNVGDNIYTDRDGDVYFLNPVVVIPPNPTIVDNGDITATLTDPDNDTVCVPLCPRVLKASSDCGSHVMEFDAVGNPTGNYIRADFGVNESNTLLNELEIYNNNPLPASSLANPADVVIDLTAFGFDPACHNAVEILVRAQYYYWNRGERAAGANAGKGSIRMNVVGNPLHYAHANMAWESSSHGDSNNIAYENGQFLEWVKPDANGILTIQRDILGHPELDGDDRMEFQWQVYMSRVGWTNMLG